MKKNKIILAKTELQNILNDKYADLSPIISDKFGIINAFLERNELSKYKLFMYQCLSANTSILFNLDREVSSGGLGVSDDKKTALISCIAEAIERYSMSFIPKTKVIYNKLSSLDKNHIFNEFYLYDDNQYKSNNFANPLTDYVHWTKIYNIDNNVYKYWPASLIDLPFNISTPVAENTSTGMAAGFTIDECIKSGLLELIERDALMINFMQELKPPQIKIDTISGKNKELIELIQKEYSIRIYKLYSDINIPIYYSLIWKKDKGKIHYGIGACASLDSDVAINKSLKECLFTYFYSKNIMSLREKNPNNITALYEHFLYYQGSNFYQLLIDSPLINYKRVKVKYEQLLDNLKEKNLEVYYKELTTCDIDDTRFKVVKVIVPGLIDLNKSHVLPRKNAKRYITVPQFLGLEVRDKISSKPHPFP